MHKTDSQDFDSEALDRVLQAMECPVIRGLSLETWVHVLFCFLSVADAAQLTSILLALLSRSNAVLAVLIQVLLEIVPDLFDQPGTQPVEEIGQLYELVYSIEQMSDSDFGGNSQTLIEAYEIFGDINGKANVALDIIEEIL